jgi:hypothetical protein
LAWYMAWSARVEGLDVLADGEERDPDAQGD